MLGRVDACGRCPCLFPELLLSGGTRDPEQLGLNAVVLVLDWLFLGQPPKPSSNHHLGLGEPLNESQLAALESLRLVGVRAWNTSGPFGPKNLGRAAAKFESFFDMLEACQTEWAELRRAGVPQTEALFSFSAPCSVFAGRAQPAYFRRAAFEAA